MTIPHKPTHNENITKRALKSARPIIDRIWDRMSEADKAWWLRQEKLRVETGSYEQPGGVADYVASMAFKIDRAEAKAEAVKAAAKAAEERRAELDDARLVSLVVAEVIKSLKAEGVIGSPTVVRGVLAEAPETD